MGKVIITEKGSQLLLFLLDDDGKAQMIRTVSELSGKQLLGDIYIGRITEITRGIGAAFVSIGEEQKVFLPLSEGAHALLINREPDGTLKCGDELPVQIVSEALKTKLPTASAKLTLTGRYAVCRLGGHGIGFSKKLSPEKAAELKKALLGADLPGRRKIGFTIRTNAGMLEELHPLTEEMRQLTDLLEGILKVYKHRTCYSCLYQAEPALITELKGLPADEYEEVVTDLPEVYEYLQKLDKDKSRFYEDDNLSLRALYGLEKQLSQALDRRVWLPGGGYLILEPTEAMVVIDVNSGKGSQTGKRREADLYLRINLEAAKEIARQLRLRNYSGMIMVDFINMEKPGDNRKLMEAFGEYLRKDPVKTRLVDMTALGIVEITRKKVSLPLDRSLS